MMLWLPGGGNDFGGSCLMHGLSGWSPHGGGYACVAAPEGVGAVLRSDDGGESMVFLVANEDMDGLLFEGRRLQGLGDATRLLHLCLGSRCCFRPGCSVYFFWFNG